MPFLKKSLSIYNLIGSYLVNTLKKSFSDGSKKLRKNAVLFAGLLGDEAV